jgi:hypothetical protein
VAGQEQNTCAPGSPAADDSLCNGIDDDCDASTDEDFTSVPTSCGEGACSASGDTTCVSGVPGDTCTPGAPAADDATCDDIDDDCDALTDEDYVTTPTACGVGACAASGDLTCVSGAEVDTCTAGPPAADDATCDGIDDDCDASTDEEFTSVPTSCGEGACSASGDTTCVSGVPGDTCTPGAPAADDATCDDIDDDCDAVTDEDYVSTPTACGIGACASSGDLLCVTGSLVDSCVEGTPAADDATCDGIDDDCDTVTDEDFLPGPTSCGLGECAQTGYAVCSGGQIDDSCVPGTPVPELCTDGLDSDCDGFPSNLPPEIALDLDFVDETSLVWTASPAVDFYSLYRGTVLMGAWSFDQVCYDSPLLSSDAPEPDFPLLPGEAYFYLVSGTNDCGEGGVGKKSDATDRPTPFPCP